MHSKAKDVIHEECHPIKNKDGSLSFVNLQSHLKETVGSYYWNKAEESLVEQYVLKHKKNGTFSNDVMKRAKIMARAAADPLQT